MLLDAGGSTRSKLKDILCMSAITSEEK
jgi:hypothetical protein